ncbi:MAG: DUF3006 domain-containing protein [Blastocatellia bacterium]
MSNSNEQIKAFVDRIESGLAVIALSDGSGVQFDLPLKYLPPGTKAGDHLVIIFQLDPESREATLKNIAELKQELIENSGSRQTEFKL